MFNKAHFQDLLDKDMDRKDFLKYSGSVLLAIIGITGAMRMLADAQQVDFLTTGTQADLPNRVTTGYGR